MVKIAPTTLTAILAILSHTAGAQSTTELNFAEIQKRVNAKTFVTRYSPVRRHGRNTVIDLATCAIATGALVAFAEISDTFDQLYDSADDLFCDGDTCTIDNAPYVADYKDACESNGGRIYTTDYEISCSVPEAGTFIVHDSNVSFCVGSFCSDDEVDVILEGGFDLVEFAVLQGIKKIPVVGVIAKLADILGVEPDCDLISSSDADPYTCAAETFALSEIEEVSNAYDQYENSVGDPVCDGGICTIDYAPYAADYNDACESNGGQIFTNDYKLSCSQEGVTLKYEFLNVLFCAGSNCTDDVFDGLIEESFEEEEANLESDFGNGTVCEYVLLEDNSSSGVVRVAFAISTAIISTGLFLL